jgi:nucleoid-associated protein YgaU
LAVIGVAAFALAGVLALLIFGDDMARRAAHRPPLGTDVPAVTRPGAPIAPPDIRAGAPIAPPVKPSFDIVRVSRDCTAVIAGRAAPGAVVIVSAGDSEIGRVTADSRGEWALVPDLPLRAGSKELRLAAQAPGQQPIGGEAGVVVNVPDCAPGRPATGEQVIAVLTPDKGASRLLQAPADQRPVPQAKGLSLSTVDYDEKGELVLSGRAQPGTTVQAYVNNQPIGAANADDKGNWQMQPSQTVPPGVYTLRVDQVADTGKVASRLEVPFQRAALADLVEREGSVIVQPGNSLWRIARRHYGLGTRYTTIYGANQDQIRDPDLIYPGQVFALPKVAQ